MLASHVLELLRKLQNPNFKFFHRNAKQLLAVNYFEKKVVEIYEVKEQECLLLQKLPFKKRVLKLFQDGEHIYFIDKFGDAYRSEFDILAQTVGNGNPIQEEKASEVDKRVQLITNFFAQTIELYCSNNDPFIILTDDYYKIKIVEKTNLQRIARVSSIRPFFARRILKISSTFLLFFDDFKVLPVPEQSLFSLEREFKESDLVELCAKSFDSFFESVELIEDGRVLAIKHNKEKKTLNLLFLDYLIEQRAFIVSKEAFLENVESDFFLVESDRIHLINDSIMFKDLK